MNLLVKSMRGGTGESNENHKGIAKIMFFILGVWKLANTIHKVFLRY